MAETPTIITCPAGTFTVRPEGGVIKPIDKIICPASPYSIRHEVGVMTGFIALFIIASVAYGIASRIANARSNRRERDRREQLTQEGFGTPEHNSIKKSG